MSRSERLLFALILALAVWVRANDLTEPANWVDESESCINALTILDEGLPKSTYLGLPIYENVLVEPWPESAEYEFKDSSYSSRGVAVYHGWLPLYSIAASFAAFGIEPDRLPAEGEALAPRHSHESMLLRTFAGRLPSVIYGALFVIIVFCGARELFGREAAFAAMLLAGFTPPLVRYAREARYYSATLCFAALAIWLLWRLVERRRARDGFLAGLAFGALFHTHVLSFAIAGAMSAITFVAARDWKARLHAWLVFGATVSTLVVPFVLWSGFLDQAGAVPKAWPLLAWPRDYLLFPREKLPYVLFVATGVGVMLWAKRARSFPLERARAAWSAPLVGSFGLGLWLLVGYLGFVFITPAASFFVPRATIALAAPAVLLAGAVIGAFARSFPRGGTWIALAGSLALLPFVGSGDLRWSALQPKYSHAQATIEHLRERAPLAPQTRLYAAPNEHLNLTFYSGLPFQSIAPIRREFLATHPGPILFVDSMVGQEPIPIEEVIRIADEHGRELDPTTARALRDRLWVRPAAVKALQRGAVLAEPLAELTDLDRAILARQAEIAPSRVTRLRPPLDDNPAIFRGFELADWSEWWPIFFWRFVDPRSRMGANANIAPRLHGARATVLRSSWTVFECGPLPAR
ncbi:MAG: glycosyltransferase family 39 protein [Planctomycetes bacterium]|nr:glycosyltransferase family 39 protein [Planctomycetota bacterium]